MDGLLNILKFAYRVCVDIIKCFHRRRTDL